MTKKGLSSSSVVKKTTSILWVSGRHFDKTASRDTTRNTIFTCPSVFVCCKNWLTWRSNGVRLIGDNPMSCSNLHVSHQNTAGRYVIAWVVCAHSVRASGPFEIFWNSWESYALEVTSSSDPQCLHFKGSTINRFCSVRDIFIVFCFLSLAARTRWSELNSWLTCHWSKESRVRSVTSITFKLLQLSSKLCHQSRDFVATFNVAQRFPTDILSRV